MPRRATSLSNISDLSIAREIDSKYDAVKAVSLKLDEIELITEMDIDGLIAQLNEALDFTGVIVVAGAEASWDPETKVLTVPTLQGETGVSAYEEAVLDGFVGTEAQWLASLTGEQGIQGIQGIQGLTGLTGDTGNGIASIVLTSTVGAVDTYTVTFTDANATTFDVTNGIDGVSAYQVAVDNEFIGTEAQWLASLIGAQGIQGETGLTGEQGIQGPQGPQGIQGIQGIQGETGLIGDTGLTGDTGATGNGIASVTLTNTVGDTKTYTITFTDTSTTTFDVVDGTDGVNGVNGQDVDHISRTSGTGAAGTTDTYTVWGDLAETVNLGIFSVYNGTDGVGPLASFVEIEFIGALGQTEFEFNYTDATTMDVIYNGAILSKSDWNASSGTLVTLTTPVSTAGDIIVIREWSVFSIVNAVTHAELNTHLGAYYDKTEVDTLLVALGTIAEFEQSI